MPSWLRIWTSAPLSKKHAHHLYVSEERGTHERGITRFIARVGIRSLVEQILHLRSIAVANCVKKTLVEGAPFRPISRLGRGIWTRWIECGIGPNADEPDDENESDAWHREK